MYVTGFLTFKVIVLAVVSTVAGIPDNAITFSGVPSVHDVLTAAGLPALAGVSYLLAFLLLLALLLLLASQLLLVPSAALGQMISSNGLSKYLSSK